MLKLSWLEKVRLYFAKKNNIEGNFWCEMELKYLRKWNKTRNQEYRELAEVCNFKACRAFNALLRKYNLIIG